MAQESTLSANKLYRIKAPEDLGRNITVGSETIYKVFPDGTIVKPVRTWPWVQVAVVDANGECTSEQFAVTADMLEEISPIKQSTFVQAQAA